MPLCYLSCPGCGKLIDPSSAITEDYFCPKCYAYNKQRNALKKIWSIEITERNKKGVNIQCQLKK